MRPTLVTLLLAERLERAPLKSTIFLHVEISTRVRCIDGCKVGMTLHCMKDIET